MGFRQHKFAFFFAAFNRQLVSNAESNALSLASSFSAGPAQPER
jgi:hypothetical protein